MGQLQPFIHHLHWKATTGRGEGRKMGEMGLCTSAGGMWMKSKGIPKCQRGEVLYSGLCPCSLIRTSPSMLWVSILNTKHLSTLLTSTLISTSQHFSTFTARLVANQSVWSVSSSQLYKFLFFYFVHIDFSVFCAHLICEAFIACNPSDSYSWLTVVILLDLKLIIGFKPGFKFSQMKLHCHFHEPNQLS